jgi:hypothetical protein
MMLMMMMMIIVVVVVAFVVAVRSEIISCELTSVKQAQ